MKPRGRSLFLIVFGIPLLLVLPFTIVGSSVFRAGSIEVGVWEKCGAGSSLEATVPAGIVPIALRVMPDHVLDEVRHELEAEAPYALDVARAAIREIARTPDGVFVDIRSGAEIVRIEKEGGNLHVLVDTPGETVRVSVSIHTLTSIASAI